jgi:synaptobrevin family protein YKT6
MKVYSISVLLAPPSGAAVVLATASDLSSFSFYQRGSAGEFMTFLSKTVTERTPQGQRQTVQEQSHVAHVYNRGGDEQLAGKKAMSTELGSHRDSMLLTELQLSLSPTKSIPFDQPFPYLRRFLMTLRRKCPNHHTATHLRSRSQTSRRTSRNTRTPGRQILS